MKLLFILSLFTINSFSQVANNTETLTNDSIPDIEVKKEKISNNSLSELDYYKLLYNQTQSNNEQYISLIQWTLGISFVFLLAIIGSQIFFNYRINKKEIDYIKKDIDEKISELKNDLSESLDEKFNILKSELKVDLTKSESEITKNIETKFSSFKEVSKIKMEVIEKSLLQNIKALEKEIEKNAGDLWKLKGVESNALSSFLRSAAIQIDLKREVKYLLDDIIDVLKKLEEIHSSDYNSLDTLIEKIKISHSEKTKEIISLYKEKPVYVYERNEGSGFGLGFLGMSSSKKYVKNKK